MKRLFGESKNTLVVLVLVAILCVGAFATWYIRYAHERDEVGKPSTDFLNASESTPYTTLEGEPFSFEPYRGKVRIVNVWASWSPYAKDELPLIAEVVRSKGNDALVALALNRAEPRERAQAFVATLPPLPELTYVVDETDAFYPSVGGYAMPETIIFNTAGDIVWHYRGVITRDMLNEQLTALGM
jgi:thiol-disulfide isomerase/thioredoxin